MTERQALVFTAAILSALKAEPAPAGVLYAALMGHGVGLDAYTAIETMLLSQGLIEKEWGILHLTPAGRELANKVDIAVSDPTLN